MPDGRDCPLAHKEQRSDFAHYRLEKAKQELESADILLRQGFYQQAANRAYYCIFHAMRAVLALEEVDFRQHSGVIAHFNQTYLKPGLLDRSLSKTISEAEFVRTNSDYRDFYVISKEQTRKQCENEKLFLQAVNEYIETQSMTE